MENGRKAVFFVWTDSECELLLRLTQEYKVTKLQDNVDWESCQSKYKDLTDEFQARYPKERTEAFPHDGMAISKTQVTSKLKNIRGKYRQAVDTGRRSGQGRVVMVFYELCQDIWAGSPATNRIDCPIDTGDLLEESSSPDPPSPHSESSVECLPPSVVKQRRHLLQAKLDSHREDRLKRRARTNLVEEDVQIKRRMLELAEETTKSNIEATKSNIESRADMKTYMENMNANMEKMNASMDANIGRLCNSIDNGFALIREMMDRPPQQQFGHPHSSNGQYHGYLPSSYREPTLHPTTPVHQHAPRPYQPPYTPRPYDTPQTPRPTRSPESEPFSFRRELLHGDDME